MERWQCENWDLIHDLVHFNVIGNAIVLDELWNVDRWLFRELMLDTSWSAWSVQSLIECCRRRLQSVGSAGQADKELQCWTEPIHLVYNGGSWRYLEKFAEDYKSLYLLIWFWNTFLLNCLWVGGCVGVLVCAVLFKLADGSVCSFLIFLTVSFWF